MEREVILVATFTLIILVGIVIIFFVIFQTKKNKYVISQIEASQRIEQEIAKSQMEIREQSLKNIAWELHDNVGQLLSTAKMQLNIIERQLPEEHSRNILEINNLIGDSLQEIRLLSKTLNAEVIRNIGLIKSIAIEVERFNKLKFLDARLTVTGDEVILEKKDEIILFRILQEFFSNVIKHSKATTLTVLVEYLPGKLLITAQDNGIGFDSEKIVTGSGLINMQSRAQLIGASYSIRSAQNQGANLIICYTLKKAKDEK